MPWLVSETLLVSLIFRLSFDSSLLSQKAPLSFSVFGARSLLDFFCIANRLDAFVYVFTPFVLATVYLASVDSA
jgi:hypothetical protein